MVGCGLEGHSRERARAHAHTHTLLCHLRQQRRRRRPHVASFAVATEAWSYKRRRPRQRGGEGRGSNRATSTRRFFPHANGNDRDVCPFGCVIRASQRISPVAGVAPANRRSDKSTDRRTDGRTDAEDRAKAALGAAPFLRPRCRCRRERSGKIASTSSSLFTTIECAIRVAPFIAAGPFFASELGQNNARAIGRIGDASEASSAARRQWNRFLPAILPLSVDRRCHYRLHTVNMSTRDGNGAVGSAHWHLFCN